MKDDSGIFGSSWRGGVRDLRASLIPTSRVGGVHRDGDGDGDGSTMMVMVMIDMVEGSTVVMKMMVMVMVEESP